MFYAKIVHVEGQQFTYLLRRVQPDGSKQQVAPEELTAALGKCQSTEELLQFFFTTRYHMCEGFLQLFEKRLRELEIDFDQPQSLN